MAIEAFLSSLCAFAGKSAQVHGGLLPARSFNPVRCDRFQFTPLVSAGICVDGQTTPILFCGCIGDRCERRRMGNDRFAAMIGERKLADASAEPSRGSRPEWAAGAAVSPYLTFASSPKQSGTIGGP
ncbi:hypothetical protein OH818_18370 [Jiella pelagia]|uniref:Uncharacterized protein n=1 Tax=Jiella pelagia TaxID=2986949 RepID=A0ABY7BV31_9HYPH|nr:hypothetical protein OH818_18370 [Jiella pelagia]